MSLQGLLCLTITLLFAAACASSGLQPGTGDISFRLTWVGGADLDLYVVSPEGERVDFLKRQAPSGGLLDIDCNVRDHPSLNEMAGAGHMCPQPMENIFWPRGSAPRGTFKYWVVVSDPGGSDPTDTYALQVRLDNRLIEEHGGTIAEITGATTVLEVELPE